jgi:hypothetical protein
MDLTGSIFTEFRVFNRFFRLLSSQERGEATACTLSFVLRSEHGATPQDDARKQAVWPWQVLLYGPVSFKSGVENPWQHAAIVNSAIKRKIALAELSHFFRPE